MNKKIFILILTLFSFFIFDQVKAEQDEFYEAEWIPNIYLRKVYHGQSRNQEARYVRRKSDDMFAYCVEHGVAATLGNTYNAEDVESKDELGISKEAMDKIKAIAYYGYGYDNHTEDKWYVVSQVLIWRAMYPDMEVYYTNGFRGEAIYPYNNEEAEILNLVNNHYTKPSFDNATKTVKMGDTITINDDNNVLSNYVIVENDTVDANIDGNLLKITPKKSGNTTLKLQRKDNRYEKQFFLWTNDVSQNQVTTGNLDIVEINLNIESYETKLEINKTGEDIVIDDGKYKYVSVKLKDVVFELYADEDIYDNNVLKYRKDELIEKVKTDKNGYIRVDNLYYGKYRLVEIESNLNNEILDEDIKFELNKDNNFIKLDIENKLDRKKLEFYKVDKDTNEPLSDTYIEIYTEDNKLIYSGITDSEGKIIIDDLFIGKFYIKEVKSKDGYILSDNIINFEIKKYDKDPIKIIMTNELIKDVPSTYKDDINYQLIFSIIITSLGLYVVKNKKEY